MNEATTTTTTTTCSRLPLWGRRELAERCTGAYLRLAERELPASVTRAVRRMEAMTTLAEVEAAREVLR